MSEEQKIIQSNDVRIQAAQVLLQMNPGNYVREIIKDELIEILRGKN